MNTKNNKRRRESKKMIEKVFVDMLQTKEINEITVSDICKKAELNRSTFYSNYTDIYDLADKIRDRLLNQVDKSVGKIGEFYSHTTFIKLFYHIKENQLFYKMYLKLGYDRDITVWEYNEDIAKKYLNGKKTNENIYYHMEFFRSGLNAIIKKWLDNGCIESPEFMADIIKTEYDGRGKSWLF